MWGETSLSELLKSLSATLVDGVFVFATIAEGSLPDNITPRMMFAEVDGITLILLSPNTTWGATRCRVSIMIICSYLSGESRMRCGFWNGWPVTIPPVNE